MVEILIRELSKHAALEELMGYPLVKKALPDGGQEIDEHMNLKKILITLDDPAAGNEQTDDLLQQLQRNVEQHVQEEEGELMSNCARRSTSRPSTSWERT